MEQRNVYFRDNFFSAGTTDVYSEDGDTIATLDLISMFSSGVELQDRNGNVQYSGRFQFFSNRWEVTDVSGNRVGELLHRIAFLAKRYTYEAFERGVFTIESEPFSRQYSVHDEGGNEVASLRKVNTWLEPAAYELINDAENLPTGEMIVVVMGMNAIQKRERNNTAGK